MLEKDPQLKQIVPQLRLQLEARLRKMNDCILQPEEIQRLVRVELTELISRYKEAEKIPFEKKVEFLRYIRKKTRYDVYYEATKSLKKQIQSENLADKIKPPSLKKAKINDYNLLVLMINIV